MCSGRINFTHGSKPENDYSPSYERRKPNGIKYTNHPETLNNRIDEKMIFQTSNRSIVQRIIRVAEAHKFGVDSPKDKESSLLVFGLKLSKLRRRRGLSLEQLAEKSNIDSDLLFAIELGIAPIDCVVTSLRSIGDALGEPEYLNQLLQKVIQDC